jgi:hypothetical protein
MFLAGTATFIKVLRGSQGCFAICISLCVVWSGLLSMSVALVDALFKIACLGYWTFKFQKYGILCNAMVQLSMIHYWLFAVKYLESGINCSGYFDQPISRLTYSLMLAACVPFIAALFYLELVLFLTYPTLEPAPDADAVTCELMHRDFVQ